MQKLWLIVKKMKENWMKESITGASSLKSEKRSFWVISPTFSILPNNHFYRRTEIVPEKTVGRYLQGNNSICN